MTKTKALFAGKNAETEFKATKAAHTPPTVEEVFLDDEERPNYILSNGKTTLKEAYDKMWGIPGNFGKPKKHTKGDPIGKAKWMGS